MMRSHYGKIAIAISATIISLFLLQRYNFLLFHTIVEFISIAIVFAIIMVLLSTGKSERSNYYLTIASGYFFVGIIDLFHTLSYKGMQIFIEDQANRPTQFWIAGRYLEMTIFILAYLTYKKWINIFVVTGGYFLYTALIFLLIFINYFPDCYITGSGLTPFKIYSEYLIIFILGGTLYLYTTHSVLSKQQQLYLKIAITATMFEELFFTFYVSVYGFSNFVGHLFKIISFLFVYRAFVDGIIKKPLETLYHQLNEYSTNLEGLVVERTEKLQESQKHYQQLYNELNHRVKNNLNTVLSLIHLQQRGLHKTDQESAILDNLEQKLHGLLILNRICSDKSSYLLTLPELIERIGKEVMLLWGRSFPLNINQHKGEMLQVSQDALSYLAFCINELFVNSMKHQKEGELIFDIELSVENQSGKIVFSDSGIGFPESMITDQHSRGTGLYLVHGFITGSLRGEILLSNQRGATITLLFPLSKNISIVMEER